MAYVFGQGTSYGLLRRYRRQAIGGLEARQQLATLAPEWRAMQARIVEGRAERERADDQVLFVDAKARVEDADFDRATTGLSGKSWSLSGKNKANEPHATLFGKLTAADIKRLGVVKASTEGRRLVKQGKVLGNPDLEPELGAFETATEALIAMTAAIEAGDDGLFAPRQAKNKLRWPRWPRPDLPAFVEDADEGLTAPCSPGQAVGIGLLRPDDHSTARLQPSAPPRTATKLRQAPSSNPALDSPTWFG